jgi:hypothetical protein
MSPNLEGIAVTLNTLATPGMKPKELLRAVREKHPEASKKDVVRAAFYSVIAQSDGDAERVGRLHDFAMQSRSAMDDAPAEAKQPEAKRRRKSRRGRN